MKKAAGLPWYKRYSPRVNYWLDVEDRELCGASVQKVVPVSEMIGKQLLDQYPGSRDRMMAPGRRVECIDPEKLPGMRSSNQAVICGQRMGA